MDAIAAAIETAAGDGTVVEVEVVAVAAVIAQAEEVVAYILGQGQDTGTHVQAQAGIARVQSRDGLV